MLDATRLVLIETIGEVLRRPGEVRMLFESVQPDSWTAHAPMEAPMRTAIGVLVEAAENDGWLHALVERLVRQFPARNNFKLILAELVAIPESKKRQINRLDHERLFCWTALVSVLALASFVGLSQGWPFSISLGLLALDGSELRGHTSALFGVPIGTLLLILTYSLARHYMRRFPAVDRHSRLPIFFSNRLPSTDPIGRNLRRTFAVLLFLLAPYATGHLMEKFLQGSVYMQCMTEAASGPPRSWRDCRDDNRQVEGGSNTQVLLGSGPAVHFSRPPSYTEYFKYRYRYEHADGKQYYPMLSGVVYSLLMMWLLCSYLITVWLWWRGPQVAAAALAAQR